MSERARRASGTIAPPSVGSNRLWWMIGAAVLLAALYFLSL